MKVPGSFKRELIVFFQQMVLGKQYPQQKNEDGPLLKLDIYFTPYTNIN